MRYLYAEVFTETCIAAYCALDLQQLYITNLCWMTVCISMKFWLKTALICMQFNAVRFIYWQFRALFILDNNLVWLCFLWINSFSYPSIVFPFLEYSGEYILGQVLSKVLMLWSPWRSWRLLMEPCNKFLKRKQTNIAWYWVPWLSTW